MNTCHPNRKALSEMMLSVLLLMPLACRAQTVTSIGSNFNGTAIAGTSYLWFNSHLTSVTFSGEAATAPEVILYVKNAKVTFSSSGVNYVIGIPDSKIIFSSAAVTSSGTFGDGKWQVTYPKSAGGNSFLGGLMWDVPDTGLIGGTNPVTWTADVATNIGSVSSLKWQWSAAVYKQAPVDPNALGVQWAEGTRSSGTPHNYVAYVTGGARGGGGSNYTGSWSATKEATNLAVSPEITLPVGTLNIARSVEVKGTVIPVGYQIVPPPAN